MQQMAQQDEELNEVNVIPLADLSLVLLIILMVLSPMATQGMIALTKAQAQAAETAQEITQPETPIIVSFEPGVLRLDETITTSDLDFIEKLEALLMKRKDKAVNLTASPLLTHGDVVRVMNMIQHHGAANLVMLKWDASANQPAAIAAAAEERAKVAAASKPGTVHLRRKGARS